MFIRRLGRELGYLEPGGGRLELADTLEALIAVASWMRPSGGSPVGWSG